jgi:hypothetical protein
MAFTFDWKVLVMAIFIFGTLVMFTLSGVFGLQVLSDNCEVQKGKDEDPNSTWKSLFWVTEGIGWAPLVMVALWVLLNLGSGMNNFVFSGIIGLVMGAFFLTVTAVEDAGSIRAAIAGTVGSMLLIGLTMGLRAPAGGEPVQMFFFRLCLVEAILFAWLIVVNTFALAKYGECEDDRGCADRGDDKGKPVCDTTCCKDMKRTKKCPNKAKPCGKCKACDLHQDVVTNLWGVNGTSIGLFVASVGGMIGIALA